MFALPSWLTIFSAYCVAAVVSMQLPHSHGDDCRVATTIAATTVVAAHVSLAYAGVAFIALWLCPAWAFWWTKDSQTVSVQRELEDGTGDTTTLVLKKDSQVDGRQ